METTGALMVTSPAKPNAVVENKDFQANAGRSKLLHRREFDPDFVFGAGSASYQNEGAANLYNRGPSIWDHFCLSTPGKIEDGSNGTMAIDMYRNYKEDVQIMKKIGLTAFRMSISWSRIFPGGRLCLGVNKDGVKFYNDLIDELLANGIQPFVTLFHWDFPQALEDEYGGFLSPKVVDDYREYAEFCFWEFGDRVKHWITFNEPYCYSYMGYGLGVLAPGRGLLSEHATGLGLSSEPKVVELADSIAPTKHTARLIQAHRTNRTKTSSTNQNSETAIYPHKGNSATEPYIVTHHILLSHGEVVDLYRKKFQKRQGGKIGIVLNCEWMIPLWETEEDVKATERGLDFMIGWFLEPLTTGHYPHTMRERVGNRLPYFTHIESNQLRGCYDFIGINYYTAAYVENQKSDNQPPNCLSDVGVKYTFERDGVPIGPCYDGHYCVPKGIYELLRYVKNKYQVPLIYVTENGLGLKNRPHQLLSEVRNDWERISFLQHHLANVRDAIHEGVNVKGYFVWSMCDAFEWNSGYQSRFGLIFVDHFNHFARYPKESAEFYRNFISGQPLFPAKRVREDGEEPTSVKKMKI